MLFVFMSQPDYACNPYFLYEYIRDHTEHETAWIIKKDERYFALKERGIRCALYNTLGANELADKADYIIMNSYTFPDVPKREGQIVANVWHGSGIKAHDYYNHSMSPVQALKLSEYLGRTDLLCVHSLDDRFKLSAQLHYDMRRCYVTGQPRLDCVEKSNGKEKIKKVYQDKLSGFDKLIFFAPSFRANASSHSGTIFSDNIFRLEDYDDGRLHEVLAKYNAALIYKLHPIEQTAFKGRKFDLNDRCFELTDEMLFDADLRYDEILNAFDAMISDYSSIVYDFLLLDRPIIYLIPDYEEYTSERGFVFRNIDDFMPGEKAFSFTDLLRSIENSFLHPEQFEKERQAVLRYRFDYRDDQSARRCYETIMQFEPPEVYVEPVAEKKIHLLPSSAQHIAKLLPDVNVIDSSRDIPEEYSIEKIKADPAQQYLYVTEEIPGELRKLKGISSCEIEDIEYYYEVIKQKNVRTLLVHGGVDYEKFAKESSNVEKPARPRIGFAGMIDNRIYFAMVQCICEVFSDYDIVFAGEIYNKRPVWLGGFDNLHFIGCTYEEMPAMIATFDVAILPFFGRHQRFVPNEFYQYLACGKQVIASDMDNLPESAAVYCSKSVSECVDHIKEALTHKDDLKYQEAAKNLAKEHDWKEIIREI